MSKKITIITFFSGALLIALLIAISLFRSNSQVRNESIDLPVPTQKSVTQISRTSYPQSVNGSVLNDLQAERVKLQQSNPLSQAQIESLQRLKDTLRSSPVDNSDFAISYDSDLDQFFIQLKSEGSSGKLEEFISKYRTLFEIYHNDQFDFFHVSTTKPDESSRMTRDLEDRYREQKYQMFPLVDLNSTQTPSPTSSYIQQRLQNQTTAFKGFLSSFKLVRIPAPTSSVKLSDELPALNSIDPTLQLNSSIPSSLDSLFDEVGQRVGIPPPVIKAVMAHECGVLLSESTANISAWSQPGVGLPITHKCFDGGVKKGDGLDLGPMQFYLPRYFEVYSQSVNQFGKYNRARPYVENIVDSVYASAYKMKLDSKSTDAVFSCPEVKRASWCYACGCSRYDNGNLNAYGCRFAPGLFQYLWGYYTVGKPMTSKPPC